MSRPLIVCRNFNLRFGRNSNVLSHQTVLLHFFQPREITKKKNDHHQLFNITEVSFIRRNLIIRLFSQIQPPSCDLNQLLRLPSAFIWNPNCKAIKKDSLQVYALYLFLLVIHWREKFLSLLRDTFASASAGNCNSSWLLRGSNGLFPFETFIVFLLWRYDMNRTGIIFSSKFKIWSNISS